MPRSPDGVALPHPISDDARAEVRRSLALSDDRVIVTLTGQVAEVKGIWEFLDAAHALVAKGSPVRSAIKGASPAVGARSCSPGA